MENQTLYTLEEDKRLANLTPRPNGLVPGTMEYQEHFRPGTSSLTVLRIKAEKEAKKRDK